jgi:hypothetical protein
MPRDTDRMTAFAVGMTSGILLALAAHILSSRLGFGLASVWREPFPTDADAVRSAFGWWTIAAGGFVGGFVAALAAQEQAEQESPQRRTRWLGGLMFLLLAGIPYLDSAGAVSSLSLALGVNLAVFALAFITACCGSWFALRR